MKRLWLEIVGIIITLPEQLWKKTWLGHKQEITTFVGLVIFQETETYFAQKFTTVEVFPKLPKLEIMPILAIRSFTI